MKLDRLQLFDVLERACSTYLQCAAGLWAASGMTDLDLSTMKMIAVSAAPAALSILKSYAASILPIGDASGSLVKTSADPAELPED